MILITVMCAIAAACVGALGNRVRGGLWAIPGGDVPARMLGWGLPCIAIAAEAGAGWWAFAIGLGAFLGCSFGQYGALSMGHRGGATGWRAWAGMTAFGLGRTFLPALVVWWIGGAWWAVILSGLFAPIAYDVVWRVPSWAYLRGLGRGDGPPNYDPPELAEALHGAAMGLALYLAIVFR